MIKIYSKIPYELKELNRWGNFRLVPRDNGKTDKIPVDSKTGLSGKSNDETTWSDFDTAVEASKSHDGLIFYFKEPYIGIDLDDIEEEINDYKNGYTDNNIVSEFVDTLGSYAELSPSGTGIHIILKGELPPTGRKKGDVEMYTSGRLFTVTGDSIGGYTHIADDSEFNKVSHLHEKYIGIKETKFEEVRNEISGIGNSLSEDDVIKKAFRSKVGEKFKLLYEGKWSEAYPKGLFPDASQSEADLAFCNYLSFWTGRDYEKMDSIFRGSGLYRDKWDRMTGETTYGHQTLMQSINSTNDVYKETNAGDIDGSQPFILIPDEAKPVEQKYYSFDDTGNGERFHDHWESIIRYNHNRNSWVSYNQQKWEIDEQENSRILVNILLKRMIHEPMGNQADEEEIEKARTQHLKYSRGTRGKDNMLREARTLLRVTADEFDQDINLLNVQNGYLDLTTGELYNHDKDKFFLKIADVEYSENVDAPLWDNFLHTIFDGDQELINYVQRAVGYSLSGESIEEKMFILHGNGRNGKSVFLNVITEMLGDYAMNIQAEDLMAQKNDSNAPSGHIARLQGARFVTSSEPSKGNRFDEGQIKNMTGTGDKITARYMRSEPFEFLPQFKVWLATNYKPKITGTDDGIWRRLSVIPFTVQIPLEKVDKRLSDKLFNEMTGILKWAVEGYKEWKRIGLSEPQTVINQVAEYRNEMDSIEQWIMDKCEREEDHYEPIDDLFNSYDSWARNTHAYRMDKRSFDAEMKEKFEYKRTNKNRGRVGLKILRNDPHDYPNNLISLDFDNVIN